jgi:hypothetical protein
MNVWVIAIHCIVIGNVLQVPSGGIEAQPAFWRDIA